MLIEVCAVVWLGHVSQKMSDIQLLFHALKEPFRFYVAFVLLQVAAITSISLKKAKVACSLTWVYR